MGTATKIIEQALLRCCDDNDDTWNIEKINHDGLRCAVTISNINDAWLIVRSSLHEPLVSIQTESDVFGGTAYICRTMLSALADLLVDDDGLIDVSPLIH